MDMMLERVCRFRYGPILKMAVWMSQPSGRCTRAAFAALVLAPLAGAADAAPAPVTVQVEFATRYAVPNVSGMLVGSNPNLTAAATNLVTQMTPNLFRVTDATALSLANTAGAKKFEEVLSEQWGYPGSNYYGQGAPWLDYATYATKMRNYVRTQLNAAPIWDIWNEPDLSQYWEGTMDQFYNTYLYAERSIRAVQSNAMIAGPSTSTFNLTFIKGLMDFCVAAGCPLNVITWHELSGTPTDISQVVAHVATLRKLIASNTAYSSLGIKEIHVNEYVGMVDQYNPAETLAYTTYLEIAKVDAAAHSCWMASDGTSNCFNNSMDGMIVPGTTSPRAPWWIYSLRGAMANRVAVTSSGAQVVGAAANFASGRTSRVLLGNYALTGATGVVNITLQLNHITQASAVNGFTSAMVVVQRIPASGEAAVPSLPVVYQGVLPVINDTITVALPTLAVHEAYCVTIAPPSLSADSVAVSLAVN